MHMAKYENLFYIRTFLVLLYELYIHALCNRKLLSAFAYERHVYTWHYNFPFTRLRWQTAVTITM